MGLNLGKGEGAKIKTWNGGGGGVEAMGGRIEGIFGKVGRLRYEY